jgi:hypothetical protein
MKGTEFPALRQQRMGGAGHWPAPFGDSPSGTAVRVTTSARARKFTCLLISSGESPDETGGSPVPPTGGAS